MRRIASRKNYRISKWAVEELSLVQRMFILDNKLSPFAANYNHNLASVLKAEQKLLRKGREHIFYPKLNSLEEKDHWLNSEKAKRSLDEMINIDPELTLEIIEAVKGLYERAKNFRAE